MQVHQDIPNFLQRGKKNSFNKTRLSVALFGLLTLVSVFSFSVQSAHASAACSGNAAHTIVDGETLGSIANSNGISQQSLATFNNIADFDLIYAGQTLCIPAHGTAASTQATPATQATIAPTPKPVAKPKPASVSDMINQIFGKDAPGARRVATCESGLNPRAVNPQAVGNSHAQGVFQVLYPSTWKTTSQAAKSPFDARANITAAHEIFIRDHHSWREWVCQP